MSSARGRLRAITALLLMAGSFACTSLPFSLRRQGCPVAPVSSADLTPEDNLRANVEMRIRGREIGFEVVARVQSEELVVVGLAPYGARMFSIHQRGTEIEVEAGSSAGLRHLALFVMDALHRAHWIGPSLVDSAETGAADFVWAGERVSESRQGGNRRRTYSRAGSRPAAPGVTIAYLPDSGGAPEREWVIDSVWCGYESTIAILDGRSGVAGGVREALETMREGGSSSEAGPGGERPTTSPPPRTPPGGEPAC